MYIPRLFKLLFFTDDGFALGIEVDTRLVDKAVLWSCVLAGSMNVKPDPIFRRGMPKS